MEAEVERGRLASECKLLVIDIITEEEVAGASARGQTTLGPGGRPPLQLRAQAVRSFPLAAVANYHE